MLSREDNERLTRVGRGTPMGELLRRYWHPIAALAELDAHPIKEVKVLGEELVLYRDGEGTLGLVGRRCAHRGASLAYGFVDQCGIRCSYHGWRYDERGRCVEQPFEETAQPGGTFKDRVKLAAAYPVIAKAGLAWAYLGPEPRPQLPDWDFYHRRGYKLVAFATIPCNWFQCQENSIDPIHFEWLHANWSRRLRGDPSSVPKHVKLRFEEFEWGITYGRLHEGDDITNPLWTTGRVCVWPNAFFTHAISWRVPIDDETTQAIWFHNFPVPGTHDIDQTRIPVVEHSLDNLSSLSRNASALASDRELSSVVSRFTLRQDVLAMTGQGRIADRTHERLGESDRGVIMMRKRFLSDLDVIASGGDPKAVIRDPAINHQIALPFVGGTASHTTPLEFFGPGLAEDVAAEVETIWRGATPAAPRRG